MRWRILSVIGLLYAVQFSPAIFAIMTVPIILRQEGHSGTVIGLVQLVGLPYVLKFLWAPLIDKFRFGRDRYKTWILVLSSIHVTALAVLAFTDPSGSVVVLFAVLFVAITAVSTQDVAVDALAISLMRPSERTMGATFQNSGMYLGAIVGGFAFLHVYELIGWTGALLIQAALFAVPLLALLLVEEPPRRSGAPPINFRHALRFFVQPRMGGWMAILATLRLPIIMVLLPIRLMMVDEGMSTEEIALWYGLIGMCAAGGISLLLGPLMRNLPRVFALYLVGAVNIAVLIMATFIAGAMPDAIRYAVVLAWGTLALTDIVLFRGAMDKVRPESPGFDFSVQVAFLTLLPMLSNPITGAVMDSRGPLPVFVLSALLAIVPMAVVFFWIARSGRGTSVFDGESLVSTSTLSTGETKAALDHCQQVFSDHGINCTRPEPDYLLMKEMGCKVEMRAQDRSVDIRIETPNENFMTFIREEVVEHLGEIDPDAVLEMRWTGGINVGEMPTNFRILRAAKRREVFPGLVRVTLSGIDVTSLTKDGIHIRVMMPETRGRKPVWPVIAENGGIAWPQGDDKLHHRFVTIRQIRLKEREIDVDVAHHEGGLISQWAVLDDDRQEVGVMGPGGDLHLPSTKNVVLAADLTGLPAIARLIDQADGQVTGHVFAAAPSWAELEAYLPPSGLTVHALPPERFDEVVVDLVQKEVSGDVGYAWFAGEFSTAQAMRSVFKSQYGLAKKQQLSVSYWRKGESGHTSRTA